jgi:hypothetical protein
MDQIWLTRFVATPPTCLPSLKGKRCMKIWHLYINDLIICNTRGEAAAPVMW